jgi:hypothetical protein
MVQNITLSKWMRKSMMLSIRRFQKYVIPVCLSLLLLLTGCASQPPSPYAKAQQESTQRGAQPAVAKTATQGSQFNKLFPDAANGFERVYTQEKKGFAEAKLKKNGKDVAMLSISDTSSLPTAAQKYAQSTTKIAGYPSVEVGATQTGILVADRYQVKVQSRDPSFTQADRQAWIQKFDLKGIAKLP